MNDNDYMITDISAASLTEYCNCPWFCLLLNMNSSHIYHVLKQDNVIVFSRDIYHIGNSIEIG